jgi:hypothetical protein
MAEPAKARRKSAVPTNMAVCGQRTALLRSRLMLLITWETLAWFPICPGIVERCLPGAEAGLRRLREGPQGKVLRTFKRARIQAAASILFEGNAQAVAVQRTTFSNVAIDRTEPRNEKNFCAYLSHVRRALLFRIPIIASHTSATFALIG